jgi:hypothetical protein
METKFFRYSKKVQFSKNLCKLFAALSVPLFVLILLNNRPSDFRSVVYYLGAMITPFLMSFMLILYVGSWPDIGINKDGLVVEFLWMSLQVPWKDIVEVKHFGSKIFGVTLITTNSQLTIIHRLYSLFTAFIVLPGFYIHPKFISSEALKTINRYIAKRQP